MTYNILYRGGEGGAVTDGHYLGATLDRNGLRPGRYYVTHRCWSVVGGGWSVVGGGWSVVGCGWSVVGGGWSVVGGGWSVVGGGWSVDKWLVGWLVGWWLIGGWI